MAAPDFGPNGERRIQRAKLSPEERAARNAEHKRRWKERNPEYQRAWRLANPEKHRAHSRATHQRAMRRKRRNQKARQRYSENPEPHRERGRRFRRDHPEKVAEYKRRFRERHPERAAEQARRGTERWRDRNADAAREKARISAAERRQADPEKFRAWYQANLERERARSRDASRLRSRLKALGLPPRSVGKVYANEKRAHAVEADQFFQRRRTAGDVARIREELKPARAILDAAWRTDAKARFEPTPTHLLAAWARDSALAKARLTRVERREMFAGYLDKHGDQLRRDAELDSRARVLRGAPPLDVEKEVKLRAAEALNEAERARLERIVARTMSSFGVPASEAMRRRQAAAKTEPTAQTQNRPERQNRER